MIWKELLCVQSSGQFYIVSYYIKWVTASWTHSTVLSEGSKVHTVRSNLTDLRLGGSTERAGRGWDTPTMPIRCST